MRVLGRPLVSRYRHRFGKPPTDPTTAEELAGADPSKMEMPTTAVRAVNPSVETVEISSNRQPQPHSERRSPDRSVTEDNPRSNRTATADDSGYARSLLWSDDGTVAVGAKSYSRMAWRGPPCRRPPTGPEGPGRGSRHGRPREECQTGRAAQQSRLSDRVGSRIVVVKAPKPTPLTLAPPLLNAQWEVR